MAKLAMMFDNLMQHPTTNVSGSGWSSALPLANLKNKQVMKVARTNILGYGYQSCEFIIDLGEYIPGDISTYKEYDGIGLVGHSVSPQGKISIRISGDPYFSTWEGYSLLGDMIYKGLMPDPNWSWSSPKFFSRRLSEIDLSNFIRVYFHPLSGAYCNSQRGVQLSYGRYIKITIEDEGSESLRNFIQIGLAFIGKRISPSRDVALQYATGHIDTSAISSSLGGEIYSSEGVRLRTFSFRHNYLQTGEAFTVLDMQRIAGNSKGILVIPNADDALYGFRRNMYARLESIKPVVYEDNNPRFSTEYNFKEII